MSEGFWNQSNEFLGEKRCSILQVKIQLYQMRWRKRLNKGTDVGQWVSFSSTFFSSCYTITRIPNIFISFPFIYSFHCEHLLIISMLKSFAAFRDLAYKQKVKREKPVMYFPFSTQDLLESQDPEHKIHAMMTRHIEGIERVRESDFIRSLRLFIIKC